MTRQTNTPQKLRPLMLGVIAAFGLAACDENGQFTFGNDLPAGEDTQKAPAPAADGTSVERDVEAPEAFQVNDNGLWDGRPSLGGVWVAHPTATDPERVIIRNEANGKFVIGALFRRELENPGPALQVSSDAAAELGMLAGAPTQLNVVALRREEVPVAAPQEATVDFDSPEDIAATPLDPIAGAAAAIDAADTAPARPKPQSSLKSPFIQIGIFSVEANARRTAERLRADKLEPSVLAQSSNGKNFWRVIVGPALTKADRQAVLQKVKALGFSDAYFVTN